MSIIMKSMKAGAVTINEFNNYVELLPVMIHIHDQHLPYYVIENGKTIFQGNLQYLEAQKQPVNSYTLKIKKADGVSVETFTDFTALSAATMVANDAGLPWFIMDNNTNKVIRKGNCNNLQKPTPAPKAGVASMSEPETPDIDIDAALDEMNDAVGDIDVLDDLETPVPEQSAEHNDMRDIDIPDHCTIVYAENGEVKAANFASKEEATKYFLPLYTKKLPIWVNTIGSYKTYNQPEDDFEDISEDCESKAFEECVEEIETNFYKIKGADYTYSKKLGIYMLFFYGNSNCPGIDGAIGLVGKNSYAVMI